jgi:short-subunit dehydrogenase
MGGVDLVIIASGTGEINKELHWEIEKNTIMVNVLGVTAMIQVSMQHFIKNKKGHLVVITSIAGLRGSAEGTVYNASKSYQSNYLEGLQAFVTKYYKQITISDIRPGFIDTEMAKGEGLFWVQPVKKAAQQIWTAILKKNNITYITKRWRLIAILYKMLPRWLYYRM